MEMITLYRNPRKNGLKHMTIDELWECVDCLNINKSYIIATGPSIEIIHDPVSNKIKYIHHECVITKSDLIKRINKVVTGKELYQKLLHRICIESYRTSQVLYIDCPEFKPEYTSLNKIPWPGCNYKVNGIEFLYYIDDEVDYSDMDGNIQCIWNHVNYDKRLKKMDELSRAIVFLETRELYVKLKCLFYYYEDIYIYYIYLYCDSKNIRNFIVK
jgi:hypothetical protein